jgi:hypothetical protein
MTTESFMSWAGKRSNRPDRHINQSDKIVPLLQQAGPAGMTRRQLTGAIDLEPELVDALLVALVSIGQIKFDPSGGIHRYRV